GSVAGSPRMEAPVILIDTSVLIYLIDPNTPPPRDPSTGEPVSRCKDRIELFIQENRKQKILIPTPAYSEIMVRAGSQITDVISILSTSNVFKIEAFDEAAAIECALLNAYSLGCNSKMPIDPDESKAKVKF